MQTDSGPDASQPETACHLARLDVLETMAWASPSVRIGGPGMVRHRHPARVALDDRGFLRKLRGLLQRGHSDLMIGGRLSKVLRRDGRHGQRCTPDYRSEGPVLPPVILYIPRRRARAARKSRDEPVSFMAVPCNPTSRDGHYPRYTRGQVQVVGLLPSDLWDMALVVEAAGGGSVQIWKHDTSFCVCRPSHTRHARCRSARGLCCRLLGFHTLGLRQAGSPRLHGG